MKHKSIFLVLLIAMLLVAITAVFAENVASTPVSDGGVTPYKIDGANSGGNRTCAEVGHAFFGDENYYQFSSERVNYDEDTDTFDASFPAGLSVSVTDGTYVSFNSSFGIGAVIVKGGNDANVYVYEPQANSDSGLGSPPNASGHSAGLSNLTFCWNPKPEPEEWCSPGYWRQDHHLDSWEATGISPDDKFIDAIGYAPTLSNKGKKDGATTDPTLWQVLQSPQYYGGDDFNAVGDLLSALHPDVNFMGNRVEDSCPLD
jgi:hypothetical protein